MNSNAKTTGQETNKKGVNDKKIHIEVCSNCRSHAWCTRHNEQKYQQMAEETKAAIQAECPGYTVEINANTNVPRIGAMEVSHGNNVIFSKMNSGLWPNPKMLAGDVKKYLDALSGGQPTQMYVVKGAEVNTKKAAPKANAHASMSPNRSVVVAPTSQMPKDDIMTKTMPAAKPKEAPKESPKKEEPKKADAQPKEESKQQPPKKEEPEPKKEEPKKEEPAQPPKKEEAEVAPTEVKTEQKPVEEPHPTPQGQPEGEKQPEPVSPEKPKEEQPPVAAPVEEHPKPVEPAAN